MNLFKKKKKPLGKVVSAFPGCGKSHLVSMGVYNICDSDSSHFPKSHFPHNYVSAIIEARKVYDVVLVSSHAEVRETMGLHDVPYFLVSPWGDQAVKEDFLNRYRSRGSSKQFIDLLNSKWDEWIVSCCDDPDAIEHYRISEGEYLSDFIEEIMGYDDSNWDYSKCKIRRPSKYELLRKI